MSPFILIVLILLAGDVAWWLKASSLLRRHQCPAPWRACFSLFMFVTTGGLVSLILLRASGQFPESAFPSLLFALVYIWHLIVLPPLLLAWGLGALALAVRKLALRLFRQKEPAPPLPPAPSAFDAQPFSRRAFLGSAIAASPALITIGATGRGLATLEDFRIRKMEVPIPNLPSALEGLSIAHVTDSHVGRFTKGAVLERIVGSTNALNADLVVFTGDLVNYSLEDLPAGIDLLKGFRARHGVYAVEGNHDLIVDARRFRRETAAAIPLLVNESLNVDVNGQAVELLGLAWKAPVEAVLKGDRKAGSFPILLAHHPHAFDHADGIPLTLSGHTHGGQLMLNEELGAGPVMFRYWSGLYRRNDRALVVSNGVGNWFPLRANAPAEIVHIVLRRTPSV